MTLLFNTKTPSKLSLAVLVGIASTPVLADKSDAIVVTATRTAQTADETIAPVTVITREDIEASGALSVPDVLRGTAGVHFTTNGPYGKTSGLLIRGAETDHVLVMIDGVKLYSATLGTSQLELLPLEQIDRIEVLRGPRASLYGPEALGGVVQIFTKKGDGPRTLNLMLGGGSDSTIEASVGISGSTDKSRYNLNVSGFETDGIDALEGAQLDDDPYDNTSISASFDHDLSDTATIGINILSSSGSTSYDNAFGIPTDDNVGDFTQQIVSLHGSFSTSDMWSQTIRLSQANSDSDDLLNATVGSTFDTSRTELSWQNDIQIGDAALFTAGIDYADDEVSGTTTFVESSRDNIGVFAQYQRDMGQHDMVVALRVDDNEQFGSFTTGNIDYSYAINDGMSFVAGVGRGFKAPSFNELYFPGFGNANLNAEESTSYEIGLQGSYDKSRWGVRLFKQDIEDLIAFDLVTFLPQNLDEADISGVEVEYATQMAGWNVRSALTLLDAENAATGKDLRRRAKSSLRLDASRSFGDWRVAGALIYQGSSFEDAANDTKLDSYTLLNLSGAYQLRTGLSLEATVENLLDEEYQTAAGYPEKGRSFFVRLRYRMPL